MARLTRAQRGAIERALHHLMRGRAYLRAMDRHIDTLPAWRWIKVYGLPAS